MNAGSSSLKFALFDFVLAPILRQRIDDAKSALLLSMCNAAGTVLDIVAHLGRRVAGIEGTLNDESDLLGATGISGDMRVLLRNDASRAAETIALPNALGGIDGLIRFELVSARHTHSIIFARIGGSA